MQIGLIGLEACSGAHFLGRALKQQGHDVRLIPAQFVKPFVKSNKNDFVDAEAIAEAVERKNMRFVPIKTDDQLDLQAMHRVRDRLVSRRTAVINQIRAFLMERGMVFAQKPAKLKAAMADVLDNADNALTPMMRNMIGILWDEWKTVEQQIEELTDRLEQIAASDAGCCRIRKIPGIGPIVATATVIITGRDKSKLNKIAKAYPDLHPIQSDVNDPQAIASLYQTIAQHFPRLNVLINNAGIMRKINLQDAGSDLKDIGQEIETNLLGPIRMVKQFLPLLLPQPDAAVVNISSGLAFSPFPISPIYCATKAGIHSFTQSLRVQLKNTKIKVFELAPPATDTPLQGAFTVADLKGAPMMDLTKMVAVAIGGLRKNKLEILPGLSKVLRAGARIAPNIMIKAASGPVDAMLAETKV